MTHRARGNAQPAARPLPTDADFTPVTTDSRRKQHCALTAELRRTTGRTLNNMPGHVGYTLCGGYKAVDQERLNHEMSLWAAGKPAPTITDLPMCESCRRSKRRRIEGRRT